MLCLYVLLVVLKAPIAGPHYNCSHQKLIRDLKVFVPFSNFIILRLNAALIAHHHGGLHYGQYPPAYFHSDIHKTDQLYLKEKHLKERKTRHSHTQTAAELWVPG